MDSELASAGLGWLASGFCGFFAGAALAWGLRAAAAQYWRRTRSFRPTVSLIFLSVSVIVAGAAVLLVAPPKALLAERALWYWAGAWVFAGLLCVLFPRWVGAPLTLACLAALGILISEASVWHTLTPGREVARFVPYAQTDSGVQGDLSVPDRNAVPVLSKIALGARKCALQARELEFSGPLANLFGARLYILSGLVDDSGKTLREFPRRDGPLRFFSGADGAKAPWIRVLTVQSEASSIEDLVPLAWVFDSAGRLSALDF